MNKMPIEAKDPIYREMMLYYDKKSEDFDNYWNSAMYLNTEESKLLIDERGKVDSLVKYFGKGNCIDLACGTSHWLAFYYNNCTKITFVDQSSKMLEITKKKAAGLSNYKNNCSFIRNDIFELSNINEKYESVVIGNILGHLSDQLLENLFKLVDNLLTEGGELFITDSLIHQSLIQSGFSPNLLSVTERKVGDEIYRIYKRYFTKDFIEQILNRYGYKISLNQFWGKYFFGLIGVKNG